MPVHDKEGVIMKTNHGIVVLALGSTLLLAGCGTPPQYNDYPNNPPVSATPVYQSAYGVVESIQLVQQGSSSSGVGGAIVGGVVGGVVGNQIGGGTGRTLATAAGAVGGALVGSQIERNRQAPANVYQVGIRLDNGALQTMTLDNIGDLRVGNRVRIENNQLYRY
jgi:outer membrane lipoprotein SlyB